MSTAAVIQPGWVVLPKWRLRIRPAFFLALLLHAVLLWVLMQAAIDRIRVNFDPVIEIALQAAPKAPVAEPPAIPPPPEETLSETQPALLPPEPVVVPVAPPPTLESVPAIEPAAAPPTATADNPAEAPPAVDAAQVLANLQRFSLDSSPSLNLLSTPKPAPNAYVPRVYRNLLTELDHPMPDLPGEMTPFHDLKFYPFGPMGNLARAGDAIVKKFGYKTRYGTEVKCAWIVVIVVCGW